MPSRGSGFEVAAAKTTFSPKRTIAEPPACLASFPVSIESDFPPAMSTETLLASGFIDHPLYAYGQKGMRAGNRGRVGGRMPRPRLGNALRKGSRFLEDLLWTTCSGKPVPQKQVWKPRSRTGPTRSRSRSYLRMPSLEITVLYRSES